MNTDQPTPFLGNNEDIFTVAFERMPPDWRIISLKRALLPDSNWSPSPEFLVQIHPLIANSALEGVKTAQGDDTLYMMKTAAEACAHCLPYPQLSEFAYTVLKRLALLEEFRRLIPTEKTEVVLAFQSSVLPALRTHPVAELFTSIDNLLSIHSIKKNLGALDLGRLPEYDTILHILEPLQSENERRLQEKGLFFTPGVLK